MEIELILILLFITAILFTLFAKIIVYLTTWLSLKEYHQQYWKENEKLNNLDDYTTNTYKFEIKDNKVYYNWKIIVWVDIKSFKIHKISTEGIEFHLFAKDKYRLYLPDLNWIKIIDWLNTNDIEVIKHSYLKINDKIFLLWDYVQEIEWVDINTFEVIWNWFYSKDKNKVYYLGEEINWADPDTFKVIEDDELGLTKDKNNYYRWNEIVKW